MSGYKSSPHKSRVFRTALISVFVIVVALGIGVGVPLGLRSRGDDSSSSPEERARHLLTTVPLIDGHNDLAWNLRMYTKGELKNFTLDQDLRLIWKEFAHIAPPKTDIPRMRKGQLGAQFWVAWSGCDGQFKDAVMKGLQQVDILRRLFDKHPDHLKFVTSADGIEDAFKEGRIASLLALEGGHMMANDLSALRTFYHLGVRYMTITWNCKQPWADTAVYDRDEEQGLNDGLSDWGKIVVKEMNRLGMMVDLSHVSVSTMNDALDESRAPVIFSHSSAYAICPNARNVPDPVLKRMKTNNGIVMVNFYNKFINCTLENRNDPGDRPATLAQVVEHIEHIRDIAGVDHVGLGSDFDGADLFIEGLEDTSKYPALVAELFRRGWSADDVTKVVGGNLLRVMKSVEMVSRTLSDEEPFDQNILKDHYSALNKTCYTKFFM